jgi:Flp pilus assembly protein TadG
MLHHASRLGRAAQRLFMRFRRFARQEDGGASSAFGLLLIPVALIGVAAFDYVRSSFATRELKDAVEAASTAAAEKLDKGEAEVEAAAVQALQTKLSSSPLTSVEVGVSSNVVNGLKGVDVTAKGMLPTYLWKFLGRGNIAVSVEARTVVEDGAPIEIALALDVSGSMAPDMPAMKAIAVNFAHQAFSASSLVKMSVVPFVAAVNVGANFNPAALDVNGRSSTHALAMRGRWVASMPTCDATPDGGPPTSSRGGAGAKGGDHGTPSGKDKLTSLAPDAAPALAEFAPTVAVSRANAAPSSGVTPNTVDPIFFSNSSYSPGPPYVTDRSTAQIPQGFLAAGRCHLQQPSVISHFDLFNRIPGARWKGCVEARPAPYDVTDEAPDPSKPDTLFVPYFAMDEPAVASGRPYNNDYMADFHRGWEARNGAPPGWHAWGGEEWARNIMKYDGFNAATLEEAGPNSKGPNAYCPDPLLPLSGVKAEVISKIESLNYWSGGGTIASEGLMWGWRTLAPQGPLAGGAPYEGGAKKYIVLMTDGLNSLVANRPGAPSELLSDYSAYNYLSEGRFGSTHFGAAERFLTERMLAACANAKARGIGVFTVLFRETNPAAIALLRQCASTPAQALTANDVRSLNGAFQSIAAQLSRTRLVK